MTRYAHAVFSDDIRQELGGKITIVGMYQGQCLVPSIPCSLAKLCVSISLSTPRSAPFKSVQVKGTYAGEEVINIDLDQAQIENIMSANPQKRPDGRRMMLLLMGVISPFLVKSAGRLSLHVTADDEELPSDSLDIGVAPPETVFGIS